ncbi:Mu-like prophage major head subunit gpT family protein [Vibrio europaeus]|uniref:Mu-like prophage major head subunit gpT family protein n=1 Tax=Vibrio europaeus TaxID=300876 RepID=UPI00233F2D80|nr:Mu-like prophage major head subunit gpT family protein [Vibrio europaeus]MDC5755220.1 Mu-like prophage major head subunit gpT family protein [Vibrio europaeus]MDC5775799.1 Mu-like prophage major head subunit gpT family protein [Vibrio europaeus]MDC5794937.1 Mu-like prophage major head subunit gpT family protein [Vibrio europaeus]MDC5799508.1 Mu-like prophage major head subunit gpT family protein [Vibrio europaeus]MDC5817216.1 Mu-like prophage major head subunit gpT family protein [Vibrio eu
MSITPEQIRNFSTGMSDAYQKGFSGSEPQFKKVATVVPSSTAAQDYGFLGVWPGIKEWVGDRQLKKLAEHGYTVTNKKFESSIAVERDKIEDDLIGQYLLQAESIGQATNVYPDQLVFTLLCDGFDNPCYDGKSFFATDHPMGQGVASNIVGDIATDTGEPWFLLDCSRPLKPMVFQERRSFEFKALDDVFSDHVVKNDQFIYAVDGRCNSGFGFWQMAIGSKAPLTEANLNMARKLIRSFKADSDTPLGLKGTMLVVGGVNEAAAEKLLFASLTNGTTNTLYKKLDLVASEYIS